MGLATDLIFQTINNNVGDPDGMERELQALFGLIPEEVKALHVKANNQEQFAQLLADKIGDRLNPPVEEPLPLSAVMYPAMTEALAKAKEPRIYDPSKTLGENLYPNSGDLFKGRV
jgi:hypothetical protein